MIRIKQLYILFFLLISFAGYAQINVPYVEDFSTMSDSVYTEATDDIIGVDYLSFNGVWTLGYVAEYKEYTDLIGVKSSSYDRDSLIFKLNLSNYDTASADLLIAFDLYNNIGGEETWKILVRQNSTKDFVMAGEFQFKPLREMMTLISSKLTPLLKEKGQNYGADFEILFTRSQGGGATSSTYEYYLDKFQVIFVPEYDIELTQVKAPEPKVSLGTTEKIELQLTNRGSETINNLPIKYIIENENGDSTIYNEGLTVNLEPDSIKTVISTLNFNLSEDNVYKITAITQLAGDPVSSNNTANDITLRPDVYIGGLPFREVFNIGSSSYQHHHYEQSLHGVTGFTFMSENPSGYMNLRNYLNLNSDFEDPAENAIFLTLDLSEYSVETHDLVLDFLYSHSYVYGWDLEKNKIYARGSEEDEWIDIFDWHDGSIDKSWTHAKYLPISTMLSENGQEFSSTFQIKFAIHSANGSLNIDDIYLRERPDHDLDVFALSPIPEGGLEITPTDTFTVSVVNFGALAENDVEVHLNLDGPDGITEVSKTINGTFNSLDTMYVGFKEPFDFSSQGNYKVTAYASIADDVNQENDSISFNTYKLSIPEVSLPFHQDFEDVPAKSYSLQAGNIDGIEGFSYKTNGRRTVSVIDDFGFNTGSNSLEVETDSELILSLDMFHYDTTYFEIFMDFAYAVDIITYSDLQPVMIRGDLDDEWVELTTFSYPLAENGDEESAVKTFWNRKVKVDITGALKAGKQIFTPYTQIKFPGPSDAWKVIYDDITIYTVNYTNLELWDMKLPKSFIDEQTSDNNIRLRLINRGESDITNFSVNLDMVKNGGDSLHHTIEVSEVSISPDDTLVYDMANPFDLSEDGRYEYIASISVPQDYYPYDDTLKGHIYNRSVITEFPYILDLGEISPDERLHLSGEFEGLPGLYIDSKNDLFSVSNAVFSNEYMDTTISQSLAANYAIRNGGEQSFTWTFDLEGQSTEDAVLLDVYYYLSYFYASYGEEDGLYVRGGTEDDWVKIELHGTNSWRSRYIKDQYLINNKLADNGQEFSSRTQVKIVCTSSYYAADFHLFKFELQVDETEPEPEPEPGPVTGLEKESTISLYPNPTSDILNVKIEQNAEIQLIDFFGRSLIHTTIRKGENRLDLSQLTTGMYLVNIKGADGSLTTKKIIVR